MSHFWDIQKIHLAMVSVTIHSLILYISVIIAGCSFLCIYAHAGALGSATNRDSSSYSFPPYQIGLVNFNNKNINTSQMKRFVEDGIIEIADVDESFGLLRSSVFTSLSDCLLHLSSISSTNLHQNKNTDYLQAVLQDGTMRYTIAFGMDRNYNRNEIENTLLDKCTFMPKDTFQKLEKIKSLMDKASRWFATMIDKDIKQNLIETDDKKAQGDSIIALVENGKHLDHFHLYQSFNKKDKDLATLPLHTDHGLFVSIVPGMKISHLNEMKSDHRSVSEFIVKLPNGELRSVELSNSDGGNSIIIMMGEMSQYISKSLRPVPHSLQLDDVHRGWFGRMYFPPDEFMIRSHGSHMSYSQLRHDARDYLLSPSFDRQITAIGCSINIINENNYDQQSEQTSRVLDVTGGTACKANEIYCWMACENVSKLPCSTSEAICKDSKTGNIWKESDGHCFTCSAVCNVPTLTPTTFSPTIKPSTSSPTSRPSTGVPTLKPSTFSPTTSAPTMKPTTTPSTTSPTSDPSSLSPSSNPTTNVPTTVSPTTVSPTTTSPTSVPTKVPTFHPTSNPSTSSPSDSPSTKQTQNPTLTTTTSSPSLSPTHSRDFTSPPTASTNSTFSPTSFNNSTLLPTSVPATPTLSPAIPTHSPTKNPTGTPCLQSKCAIRKLPTTCKPELTNRCCKWNAQLKRCVLA